MHRHACICVHVCDHVSCIDIHTYLKSWKTRQEKKLIMFSIISKTKKLIKTCSKRKRNRLIKWGFECELTIMEMGRSSQRNMYCDKYAFVGHGHSENS